MCVTCLKPKGADIALLSVSSIRCQEKIQSVRCRDLLRADDNRMDSCSAVDAPSPDNFQTILPSSSLSKLMDEAKLSLLACRFNALLVLENNDLAVLSIWDDLEGLRMSREVVSGASTNELLDAEAEWEEEDPVATVLMPYSEFDGHCLGRTRALRRTLQGSPAVSSHAACLFE